MKEGSRNTLREPEMEPTYILSQPVCQSSQSLSVSVDACVGGGKWKGTKEVYDLKLSLAANTHWKAHDSMKKQLTAAGDVCIADTGNTVRDSSESLSPVWWNVNVLWISCIY